MAKDHCTWFPEYVFGIYIGNACRGHDDTCSTTGFYNNLVEDLKPLTFKHEIAALIAVGGMAGCWVKYTKFMINRVIKRHK